MAVSHTCCNPFIYCWMNLRIRHGFMEVLGKKLVLSYAQHITFTKLHAKYVQDFFLNFYIANLLTAKNTTFHGVMISPVLPLPFVSLIKVEIILEHREVAFLSPSKICENLNFCTVHL